ncbi:hypothetical protein [Pseudotenacibaculum sp. MALMAid0570]|uniref:hypothetical protein n=1 Tax=Pseudotenacibaculum sp. MALMAid0570 TaxID=3143938 RepID=UPI0032DEEA3A
MKKVTFLALFLVTLGITAQSVKLEYKLKKGDKFLIEMKMKQNMAPIMDMDIGLIMTTETVGVKEGIIENKSQIKRMKMDISAQGETMSYDTSKKASELTDEEKKMHEEIGPILDMVIYQTLDKTGEILSQKTVPELKQADQLLNQNQITAMVYPKEALKVGSTWDFNQSMNGIKMKAVYKVAKITSNTLFADISGTMEGVADAKLKGKLEIDLASGMPAKVNMDIDMGTSAMGLKMNIQMICKKM